MMDSVLRVTRIVGAALGILALLALSVGPSWAGISGVTGTSFSLTARSGAVSSGDGASIHMWGYALDAGGMQYPGPTLTVNQGDTITVDLANELSVPVSIVFPGQLGVSATTLAAPTAQGLLALEAGPGGSVRYSFTATHAGTYLYHSGTNPDLQVEMGLQGAIVVRPAAASQAYGHPSSSFDQEYLFYLSEVDPAIHAKVEMGDLASVDTTQFHPNYWFINGRTGPDTLLPAGLPWMPSQPYSALAVMCPGESALLRFVGGGRDPHPFHTHGNNFRVIARDGRLRESAPGAGADVGVNRNTMAVEPGQTVDAIFQWTGVNTGWDIYGHQHDIDNPPLGGVPGVEDVDHNGNGVFDSVALLPGEDPSDHGKPLPIYLPEQQFLTFGAFWSGSPFLGNFGALPPGEGGFNLNGAYWFIWHSHHEGELTNDGLFPGGMLTMMVVAPPGDAACATP